MSTTRSIPEVAKILAAEQERQSRVTLRHGDVFVLTGCDVVDPSIYDEDGRWCCTIVEAISGASPLFHKLFLPGSGLDILEQDVQRIEDYLTGAVLFDTQPQRT
jgi:hypothetical protein